MAGTGGNEIADSRWIPRSKLVGIHRGELSSMLVSMLQKCTRLSFQQSKGTKLGMTQLTLKPKLVCGVDSTFSSANSSSCSSQLLPAGGTADYTSTRLLSMSTKLRLLAIVNIDKCNTRWRSPTPPRRILFLLARLPTTKNELIARTWNTGSIKRDFTRY